MALTEHEFDGCSILEALGKSEPAEIAYLMNPSGPLPRRLDMETTRWTTPAFTRFDGALESKEALAAALELAGFSASGPKPGRRISPTSLEDYASCPFRYFLRNVLDIETIDEPEETLELSPIDRGSLYHDILERFMRDLRDTGRLPPSREDLTELQRTARRLLDRGEQYLPGFAGARHMELQRITVSLALWLAAELRRTGGFVPAYFEARFGGEPRVGDDPELSLLNGVPFDAEGGVHIEFSGKIDRIDVTSDGTRARVIDYKTGKPWNRSKKRESMLEHGTRLQLPIYILAARKMLTGGRVPVIESAEYQYVTTPAGATSVTITAEELEERADDLSKAVGIIIHLIRNGLFFPYPSGENVCKSCEYRDACASTSLPLAVMKNHDRKAEPFVYGLAEIA